MILTVKLTGTRPLLMRNSRLSDPRNKYTRRIKELTGKLKKMDEDFVSIMVVESRGGCWETLDGCLGMPTANVWRGIYDAAKRYKMGQNVKAALLFDDVVEPLLLDGKKIKCEEFLKNEEHIDYRSVVIMKKRTMRARPRVPAGWQSEHRLELLTDVLEPKDLKEVFTTFGRLIGIGDWRPTYGRVNVEVTHGND